MTQRIRERKGGIKTSNHSDDQSVPHPNAILPHTDDFIHSNIITNHESKTPQKMFSPAVSTGPKMDHTFSFPSQSTAKTGQEDAQMIEEKGPDSSMGKSSAPSVTEVQERHPSLSIDDISRQVQELVEKINDSRTSDQKVMDSYQRELVEKMTGACQQMKEKMFMVYEENSIEMQVKLQELSQVLGSCTKLSDELLEARRALAGLREALAISETSEAQ